MPKHNQSARIGDVTDFVSTPTPPDQTDTERIGTLEQRVATLEMLLNDVMLQLDKPYNTQTATSASKQTANPKGKGPKTKSPKQQPAKPNPSKKNAPKPKNKQQQRTPKPETQGPQWGEDGLAKVKENTDPVLVYARQHPDGITKQQTIDATGLENKLVGRVLAYLCSQKQMTMKKPPATESDPDPKMIFTAKSKV